MRLTPEKSHMIEELFSAGHKPVEISRALLLDYGTVFTRTVGRQYGITYSDYRLLFKRGIAHFDPHSTKIVFNHSVAEASNRRPKMPGEKIRKLVRCYYEKAPAGEAARIAGVSRYTVYRYYGMLREGYDPYGILGKLGQLS